MSEIGYYRYKLDNLPEGESTISFYVNGALAVTHSIVTKPFCIGSKIIKYLDKDSQYRLYPFNKYYEERINAKLIGKTNEFITSILTAQTNEKNIGYKSTKVLSLVADAVSDAELTLLSQLIDSPRVYLYIGTGTSDEAKDWILVTVVSGDNVTKRRKANFGKFSIDIELPEHYTVSMV